jgi:hypothetical protein
MFIRSHQSLIVGCLLWSAHSLGQAPAQQVQVPLVVPGGSVLRMRTKATTFPKQAGEVVHAQLTQPVFAFDREVLPAGTEVIGHVIAFRTPSRLRQIESMTSGHFGSFKKPEIQFDTVLQPGKAPRTIVTDTTPGNGQTVELRSAVGSKHGVIGSAVARGKQEISTRWKEAKDLAKADNKKERARDAAMALLPYQPSRIAGGSQFDAVLMTPQTFGSEMVPAETIMQLGQTTPEDGRVTANLVTGLDSAVTKNGSPVEAKLTAPLFTSNHQLLLPEGTRLVGNVSAAQPARHFHRSGQLRFSFQEVTLPDEIIELQKRLTAQTAQVSAESARKKIHAGISGLSVRRGSHIGLDDEGVPRVEESKTRFLGPALSVALVAAANSQEEEHGRVENQTGAQTAAGASGFALIGAIVGRTSHVGALAIGSLGAARSVYSQFLGKGIDIQLPANTALAVQFSRTGTTLPKDTR